MQQLLRDIEVVRLEGLLGHGRDSQEAGPNEGTCRWELHDETRILNARARGRQTEGRQKDRQQMQKEKAADHREYLSKQDGTGHHPTKGPTSVFDILFPASGARILVFRRVLVGIRLRDDRVARKRGRK